MTDPIKCHETREPLSHGELYTFRWEGLDEKNHVGVAKEVPPFTGRTVQLLGSANVQIEGSLNGQDWAVVLDVDESSPLYTIKTDVRFIRPKHVGGDKATVIAMFRKLV